MPARCRHGPRKAPARLRYGARTASARCQQGARTASARYARTVLRRSRGARIPATRRLTATSTYPHAASRLCFTCKLPACCSHAIRAQAHHTQRPPRRTPSRRAFCCPRGATRVHVSSIRASRVRIPSIRGRFPPPDGAKPNPEFTDGQTPNPGSHRCPNPEPRISPASIWQSRLIDIRCSSRPSSKRGFVSCPLAQPGFAFRPSAHPGCGFRPSRGVFRAQTAQSRTRNSPTAKRRTQGPPMSKRRTQDLTVEHPVSSRQAADEPGSPIQPDSTPLSPSPMNTGPYQQLRKPLLSRRIRTSIRPDRAPGAARQPKRHPRSPPNSPAPSQLTNLASTLAARRRAGTLAARHKKPSHPASGSCKPLLARWEAERPYGRINRLPGTFAFDPVPRYTRWCPYT